MPTLISRAQGGPRDGVKLMCPHNWDGTIERPRNVSGPITRYPGRYVWDDDFEAWIWHADKVTPKTKSA